MVHISAVRTHKSPYRSGIRVLSARFSLCRRSFRRVQTVDPGCHFT